MIKKLIYSVHNASNGLRWFMLTDRNGKIQLIAMLLIVTLGICMRISTTDFCILLVCCAMVIGLEMVNHAIEQFCDDYHAGYKTAIKTIKDVSAGAVLWCSILSAIIACILFYPYVLIFFS
jgi:diacylglycerol kinase